MIKKTATVQRRAFNISLLTAAVGGVVAVNAKPVQAGASYALDAYTTSREDYKQEFGQWQTISFPEGIDINAIHAALLHTGKILLIAGSGNDTRQFAAGSFRSVLWDPINDSHREIDTPEDLFCGGHAYLPNGDLLIAGGTRKYEVLKGKVEYAAGPMTIFCEDPDIEMFDLAAGTVFTHNGRQYVTVEAVHIMPAAKDEMGKTTASQAKVWAQALDKGEGSVVTGGAQYVIEGMDERITKNVYGIADAMTLDKQNYQGLDASYIFKVNEEVYEATGRLNESRWYPTLISIQGGNVLAVSGLDENGFVLNGQNEEFEISAKKWFDQPQLNRYFPTYPGLHRMADDRLFYSGTSTGYGPAEDGRQPGLWNLSDNTFEPVLGLRDPDLLETASSVLLPPVQNQQVMVVGGGGVGESSRATARMDIVDLDEPDRRFRPAGHLREVRRYPNLVTLPNDTVLITGGSTDYRGKGKSDVLQADIYTPATDTLKAAADPRVGRNYHTTALLLPNGQVLVMGSDPLFADEKNTMPGKFEQRVEIFSPPYLFAGGARPVIADGPARIQRGTTVMYKSPDVSKIVAARLLRPSAVTHATDTEQRSVALDITPGAADELVLSVPESEGILPSGFYMLFAVDEIGIPSEARWVLVE